MTELDDFAHKEEVRGEDGRIRKHQAAFTEADVDGMEDAYENLQQVGGNELALFAEEGVEHCYDLGQKGDVLRVQEVKIAQGIVCKGSGSGQRHTTQQWQRRGLHVANDADERNGIQL